MPGVRTFSEIRLVNGSTGDPVLYVDYPGKDNALLLDGGDNAALDTPRLADLEAVFITHHHVDHFIGLDRIVRANIDQDKTLHVFGPAGTIRKVADRIRSYEYPFFPFQKIVVRVTEILPPDKVRTGLLECTRRFPEPAVEERPWEGPVIFENTEVQVEAAPTDHTVPGLAYAIIERPGLHPDRALLQSGPLKPGPWIGEARKAAEAGASPDTLIDVGGVRGRLGDLLEKYFVRGRGSRVAYIVDTQMSDAVRPGLLRLARKAARLYCDSFYHSREAKSAAQHRHMTAAQAGEFAAAAKVEELVLVHFSQRYRGRWQVLLDEARTFFPTATAELPAEGG